MNLEGHAMRNNLYLLPILVLGLTLGGCGGSSGGSDDPDDPIADVSGTWDITETMGSNSCDEVPGTINTYEVTVTMSGNSVTVVTPVGTFTGTIDGDQLEWTGSYPEDGGTTTIENMDLTVSVNGSSLSGATNWSWTNGNINCSGVTSVSGVRTSGGGGGSNACGTVTEIGPNESAAGNLETTDCRIEDMFPGSGDMTYADEYRVTLSSGGTLTIVMRSSAVDAFLALVDFATSCTAAGCTPTQVITFDDDSGGGSDAQISVSLAAGTYIIFANSFSVGTGSYTLETTFP